jgi:LmbE family N-acetylglucosaminyl deacetylase
MLGLILPERISVLCLGAHADDIEIGCGGTILTLLDRRPAAEVWWCVLSGSAERAREAKQAGDKFLATAGRRTIETAAFRDGFFPAQFAEIKTWFDGLAERVAPDLILTHYRDDRHQDHRVVSDLTWNTFRDHAILEYEVPKYDGDIGQPNLYQPLPSEVVHRKLAILATAFESQRSKDWYDEETFRGLMRLRGVECRAPERYAEAFHARKITLGP